jgi:hypothetical protein
MVKILGGLARLETHRCAALIAPKEINTRQTAIINQNKVTLMPGSISLFYF